LRNEIIKKHRLTEIYFNEQDNVIYGRTYNTKFKKQLLYLAEEYPNECKLQIDSETGSIDFEANKNRLCLKINPKITDERRVKLSHLAKSNIGFYQGSAN